MNAWFPQEFRHCTSTQASTQASSHALPEIWLAPWLTLSFRRLHLHVANRVQPEKGLPSAASAAGERGRLHMRPLESARPCVRAFCSLPPPSSSCRSASYPRHKTTREGIARQVRWIGRHGMAVKSCDSSFLALLSSRKRRACEGGTGEGQERRLATRVTPSGLRLGLGTHLLAAGQ